jgi:hypothetical protein
MISTKDFASVEERATAKTSPIIGPGTTEARIQNVQLLKNRSFDTDGSVSLVLNLETAPVTDPNFQGFFINPSDPTSPRHLGQIGRVKYKAYPMKDSTVTRNMPDGTTKTINNKRDNEYLQAVINLANTLGAPVREAVDNIAASTIFDHVDAVSRIFANRPMVFTIAASGYKNAKGYTAYDLYLPYDKTGKKAYVLKGNEADLITFDKALHVSEPKEDKAVAGFEPNNDFSL